MLLFLLQIKALRRERVETILGKEELVDDPADSGIIHIQSVWFVGFGGLIKLNHAVLALLFHV